VLLSYPEPRSCWSQRSAVVTAPAPSGNRDASMALRLATAAILLCYSFGILEASCRQVRAVFTGCTAARVMLFCTVRTLAESHRQMVPLTITHIASTHNACHRPDRQHVVVHVDRVSLILFDTYGGHAACVSRQLTMGRAFNMLLRLCASNCTPECGDPPLFAPKRDTRSWFMRDLLDVPASKSRLWHFRR
jgi:hypothetical protein